MADWTTKDSELDDSKHFPNCVSLFMSSRMQLLFSPPFVKSLLQGPATVEAVSSLQLSAWQSVQ